MKLCPSYISKLRYMLGMISRRMYWEMILEDHVTLLSRDQRRQSRSEHDSSCNFKVSDRLGQTMHDIAGPPTHHMAPSCDQNGRPTTWPSPASSSPIRTWVA